MNQADNLMPPGKPRVRWLFKAATTSVVLGLVLGSPIAYLHVREWPPIVDGFNWLNAHPPGGMLVGVFGILYLVVSVPLSLAVSLSEPENVELAAQMMLVGWYPTWWVTMGAASFAAQLARRGWVSRPRRAR